MGKLTSNKNSESQNHPFYREALMKRYGVDSTKKIYSEEPGYKHLPNRKKRQNDLNFVSEKGETISSEFSQEPSRDDLLQIEANLLNYNFLLFPNIPENLIKATELTRSKPYIGIAACDFEKKTCIWIKEPDLVENEMTKQNAKNLWDLDF